MTSELTPGDSPVGSPDRLAGGNGGAHVSDDAVTAELPAYAPASDAADAPAPDAAPVSGDDADAASDADDAPAQALPFGSWPSPISAEMLARGGAHVGSPMLVGEQVWWTESIAEEGGRSAIVRTPVPVVAHSENAGRKVVLPAPWNARSRVHEYGGASWTVIEDELPLIVFVNFADQRVYAFLEGQEPRALTPEGPEVASAGGPSLRFAQPTVVTLDDSDIEVWWVVEDHTGEAIERYIGAVPLDGAAARDASRIRRVTPSSRFVAHPRVSPDGTRVAWLSWEHPQMPWDGTELHVAELVDRVATDERVIDGDTGTSIMQPEWLDSDNLMYISDRSGWWNPWVWSDDGVREQTRQVLARESEFAGPLWTLGETWYQVLDPHTVIMTHGRSTTQLAVLDVATGRLADLPVPLTSINGFQVRGDGLLVLLASSLTSFPQIVTVQLGQRDGQWSVGEVHVLRSSREDAPDPAVLPEGYPIEVPLPEGGVVHATVYEPTLSGYAGAEGELPPYIAMVHGGPTAMTPPTLKLGVAYWTSRGLGVVEVNYGGSTGFGREYRDRLKGQWGVVDVEDTVAVMNYLVEKGIADGNRLAIEGGSAGGWTTLACLTRTDTFHAGISSFGVAELEEFIRETHDFESRYIDQLVGPYPEQADVYRERAPLSHVESLSVPVLLLQGDEDRIVPPAQSERFRDALAAKGIAHAYLLFEGEQHGFRKPETIIAAMEASASFYGQVFGFEPVGIPMLELVGGESDPTENAGLAEDAAPTEETSPHHA